MMLYAVTNGYLDDIPLNRVAAFETEFYRFIEASYKEVGQSIAKTKELNNDTEEKLKKAIIEFKQGFMTK
ncbi:MAG: F0F1 ATP synthase subunit alpha, partial [Dehalococcoidales bacterium]